MDRKSVKRVTDAATLKAITHPLRARMLGTLRLDGPATASELGRRFGESSGTTSYHLRILEKHGFIEEDPEQPNLRDRRWKATTWYTSWDNADFADDPEGVEVTRALRRRQLDNVVKATERFEDTMGDYSKDWISAAGHSDHAAELTPASVRELRDRVTELVRELGERDKGAEGTEVVRIFTAMIPVPDAEY